MQLLKATKLFSLIKFLKNSLSQISTSISFAYYNLLLLMILNKSSSFTVEFLIYFASYIKFFIKPDSLNDKVFVRQ